MVGLQWPVTIMVDRSSLCSAVFRTIIPNSFIYLSGNSSQMIGPQGFKFSEFDGGHPEVVTRKFDEDHCFTKLFINSTVYSNNQSEQVYYFRRPTKKDYEY